ncbi:hypothetical protein CSUI_005738 [Cystoisospora suis]|uniref:Uncharacterized protein n=1 Tax=Cystoisospora suis TaxID=483139 RepID=A0A2C6KU61_9APIC|nr:hypothetical protein CSUI_005738 [Cystoisospora suis]
MCSGVSKKTHVQRKDTSAARKETCLRMDWHGPRSCLKTNGESIFPADFSGITQVQMMASLHHAQRYAAVSCGASLCWNGEG